MFYLRIETEPSMIHIFIRVFWLLEPQQQRTRGEKKADKNATLHVSSIYCYKHFAFFLLPLVPVHFRWALEKRFNCIFRLNHRSEPPFNSSLSSAFRRGIICHYIVSMLPKPNFIIHEKSERQKAARRVRARNKNKGTM